MVPKSKFLSKFPISKWSFVNLELFKSLELIKYIIYSHRTETLMLERLGANVPSSTKVHNWCHDDDNVLMSPSFFFPTFHNPTYTHKGVFFSHCSIILRTPCIILPLHLHVVALPCNLSYFYIFTLLLCFIVICIFKFHHALSTSLGFFFFFFYMFHFSMLFLAL